MTLETWSLISSIIGVSSYVLFTVLLFQRSIFLDRPMFRRIYPLLMIVLLAGPPVLCGSLLLFRGDAMMPQLKGMFLADGFVLWYAIGLMLLALPVVRRLDRRVQAKMQAAQKEPLKPQQKLVVPVVGFGCVVPLILFFVATIALVIMGVRLVEYNPNFDGPQPIVEWCGIDMVIFFDRLAGSIMLSVTPIFLLTLLVPILQKENHKFYRITLIELIVLAVIIAGLVALLWPAVKAARETPRKLTCSMRMKMLGLALHNYQYEYGTLPPAYTVDAEGNKLHSWRVLLLPFLEQQALYEQIRLDEPWDSEHNSRFHATNAALFEFRCPDRENQSTFFVSYYVTPEVQRENCDYSVIIGTDTLFPGAECRSLDELTDTEKTTQILCIERRSSICWMDPTQEITVEAFKRGMNQSSDGPGSEKHSGATVVFADGMAELLLDNDSPSLLPRKEKP